jgi:phage shock protein A
MGIFARVSDIISANLNDMVERFESPETMLRQAIREMDAAIARTMEATARAIADERLIEHERGRHREQSTELLACARARVARGDESSARRSLVRRQEHEKLVAALEDQLAKVRSSTEKIRRQLDAMRVRRAEAQRMLHVLIARDRAAAARRELAIHHDDGTSDVRGLSRFDHLRKTIERREAEADALVELAGCGEIEAPESDGDHQVESQLRVMKAEVVASESNER